MKKLMLILVMSCFGAGCANWPEASNQALNQTSVERAPKEEMKGRVQHVVLIWFKSDVSEQYIKKVTDETKQLTHIPGVITVNAGQAIPSDRPMVDDSFDLGVTMTFDSVADMKAYVNHPEHKAFLKRYIMGKVEKLSIFDFQ
ncbi:Dabb family protein [Litoribrevibacter albus]|uniref:Stress-response A/B barrel domain-containing protein n=1 Tax=Litoribrevibacter albus TaxID=1473156 RepID=A0AA37S8N2_9GAMM|nr:Dabb family protein [Litoribrevibacter albus]GLQ30197.1 hypothetical protein GCM10007876_06750 [Litoribrevibacter albus]